MDEEPNEHELEERLYAMLHHVDETQANVNTDHQNGFADIVDNAPRSTIRRYWRTSGDHSNPYQKVNTPKEADPAPIIKKTPLSNINKTNSKPKEEKPEAPEVVSADLSLFQSPPQIINKTIEIIDHEIHNSVLLESSDEDEVVEVELPPKPTITIESSDEDEVCIVSKQDKPTKQDKNVVPENISLGIGDRGVSASPVPSVVSSVSDEFIRSDCIALNISSRHPDNHSFDFTLHGSDLLGQVAPSKKKKKKKSKEAVTSTPVASKSNEPSKNSQDSCFATPKSKAKNKKQKNKSYTVSEKSIPSADVYDSDSNQSVIDTNKDQQAYTVTEKSLPSADVYESDSSLSECVVKTKPSQISHVIESSDSSNSLEKPDDQPVKSLKRNSLSQLNDSIDSIVDLTDSENNTTLDTSDIAENIVMANVTGFMESEDYGDEPTLTSAAPKFGSTKVPQILFDNLDFDNLKGKDKVCKRRRYSLTTLRAEMEKFYNESWGGEDFNHREIQKYMSRDKSLWVIDPKDRMPALSKRKVTCNYCNRAGHRDDSCRLKPPVCYMCGCTGHYEPRCPSKICVNCGSPNHMYSSMCRKCSVWARVTCAACGQRGHPDTHCPDHWRRYHNTIDSNTPLVENRFTKKSHQLYCSGCTRRGHLVHSCRVSLPFSGLPIYSPYVALYHPIHHPEDDQQTDNNSPGTRKRQSKSPTVHENHVSKKKMVDIPEEKKNERQRKNSKNNTEDPKAKEKNDPKNVVVEKANVVVEKAPDFIPITSTNRDKRGQMIQDNEVSDTSDVVTLARIYVTNDIIDRLKTEEGQNWLKESMSNFNVTVQNTDVHSFLSIKGKLADQEAFQLELREWSKGGTNKENFKSDGEGDVTLEPEHDQSFYSQNIPKNRNNVLRKLSKAFESLKNDLGDPKTIYKELNYLQNRHEQLINQRTISPKQVSNNRDNINEMLKKLNMVLIGQAGLADGSKHLSELYSLHEKLTNFRQKNISSGLRKEIGQHFHSIFTAIPRDDYVDLMKIYYGTKKQVPLAKKNKFKLAAKKRNRTRKKSKANLSQSVPDETVVEREIANVVENIPLVMESPQTGRPPLITTGKLVFYHKRILNSRPADSGLKKLRVELVRKLHSQIASLYRNERMCSKTVKKMKKLQQQAQMFLSNV